MIALFGIGLSLTVFMLTLLWILVPAFYGLPSVPTNPDRIRKALKLANLRPDETLYDLGAGDGRVLLIAALEFGAHAIGVEVGPVQCALIWLRLVANRAGGRARIQLGNFYKSDLRDADIVFVYATSKEVAKLESHFESQLKPDARVVSISADFPNWEPLTYDDHDLIFVYEMPPKRGSVITYLLKKEKE